MLSRRHGSFAFGVASAAALLVSLAAPVAAQSSGCPLASDSVVSLAVGMPVSGSVDSTSGALTLCTFSDGTSTAPAFGVSRESDAFGPSEGGAAALARRYVPGLPDAARDEISALSQAGMNISLPDYQFESVSGIGDSAVWVQTQLAPGSVQDSLLVQSGGDGYAFDVEDGPGARASLTALAQAVLAGP